MLGMVHILHKLGGGPFQLGIGSLHSTNWLEYIPHVLPMALTRQDIS